jgi:hypothetical protein
MAEKKITKLMVIEMMLADEVINGNETYKNYLENEKEILQKKSANRKATKNQTENAEIKEVILDILAEITSGRAGEIQMALQKSDEKFGSLSNQRVSAILKQMVEDGAVVKTVDKKVSIFRLA